MTRFVPILFPGILYCWRTLLTLSILSRFHTVHSVPQSRCPLGPAPHTNTPHLSPNRPSRSRPSQDRSNHSQPSVARLETPNLHPATHRHLLGPLSPPQIRVLLNTNAHCNNKNACGRHSAIRPPSLGRLPNAQRPPALSHPDTPGHATVKHSYPSPLSPPLLGATHRLPHPNTAPPGTSEIFSVRPVTFCLLHLTPSALCPSPGPLFPSRVTQHSSNHTIRANVFPFLGEPPP